MSKIQDVNFPTITTLLVEVKALRIGKKQCTISVFKQLESLYFSKDTIVDKMEVWGYVKYKEDDYYIISLDGSLHKIIDDKIDRHYIERAEFIKRSIEFHKSKFYAAIEQYIKKESSAEYLSDLENDYENIVRAVANRLGYEIGASVHQMEITANNADSIKKLSELSLQWEKDAIDKYLKRLPLQEFIEKCQDSEQLFIAV